MFQFNNDPPNYNDVTAASLINSSKKTSNPSSNYDKITLKDYDPDKTGYGFAPQILYKGVDNNNVSGSFANRNTFTYGFSADILNRSPISSIDRSPSNYIKFNNNNNLSNTFLPINQYTYTQQSLPYGWDSNTLTIPIPSPRTSISSTNSSFPLINTPHASPLPLYPPPKRNEKATLLPYPNFNTQHDINELQYAVNYNNNDKLIEILCHRSLDQRMRLSKIYQQNYGIQLMSKIKFELFISSDFSDLISGLAMPLHVYFAITIHESEAFRWICYVVLVLSNQTRQMMREWFAAGNIVCDAI